MKWQLYACFLSVFLIYSCSHSTPENKATRNKTGNKSLPKIKPAGSFSDTLTINSAAAVFYSPDSIQLEKIRSVTDPGVFEATMHEYDYLMKTAHSAIKKNFPLVNVVEAKKVRYLRFINADKKESYIDLDTKYDPYGLVIFNRKDPPQLVDMANTETELGFYFSK